MSYVQNSPETHAALMARIPTHTDRDVSGWMRAVDEGPSLMRFEERANWLRDEYDLPLGYAHAIIHEYDLNRAARRSG
jgi:hypothetical protein